MVMLTAVGNNGAVYAIEKDRYISSWTAVYFFIGVVLFKHLDYLKSPEKYFEYIQDFFERV